MLVALSLLALVALSSGPIHASASPHAHAGHAHRAVAHRKRDDTSSAGRCIPRTPSALPTSTSPSPSLVPPTSTTPSTTSSAPSATASSNGKGCYAWGTDATYLPNFNFPRVQYIYNWNPSKPAQVAETNLQFMPMLWGVDQETQFAQTVVQGYASFAVGVNEPNEPSQSNLSPKDAFGIWMQYINPLKDEGYTLISPPCTDDDAGLEWYAEFFNLCTPQAGCHVDLLAFHGYNTNAEDIINYATKLYQTYSLPIAILEFADQNFSGVGSQASMDSIWDFAGKMVDFIANTPWVAMGCPFGIVTDLSSTGVNALNSLITSDGQPTSLAYYYFENL